MHIGKCACGSLKLMSPYSLRRCLSVQPELARTASLALGIPLSLLAETRLTGGLTNSPIICGILEIQSPILMLAWQTLIPTASLV